MRCPSPRPPRVSPPAASGRAAVVARRAFRQLVGYSVADSEAGRKTLSGGGSEVYARRCPIWLSDTQPRLATQMAANTTNPATPTTTLPAAEDKAACEAAKKDLVQALTKKRNVDKQLVSSTHFPNRSNSYFDSGTSGGPTVSSGSLVPDRDHDKQWWKYYYWFRELSQEPDHRSQKD